MGEKTKLFRNKYSFRILAVFGVLLLASISFVILTTPQVNAGITPSIEDDMVLFLHLDNDATDSSNQGNDGIVEGAVFTSGGGILSDGEIIFDGVNDYINFTDKASLDIYQNSFTIAFWLNARNITNNVLPRIMEKDSSFIAIMGNPANARFSELALEMLNETGTNTIEIWSRDQSVTLNTWEHWALTYNGTGGQWYKNGVANTNMLQVSIGSDWMGTERDTSGFEHLIARRRTDLERNLNGSLDDVIIWSRELSGSEITTLYESYVIPTITINGPTGESSSGIVDFSFNPHDDVESNQINSCTIIMRGVERSGEPTKTKTYTSLTPRQINVIRESDIVVSNKMQYSITCTDGTFTSESVSQTVDTLIGSSIGGNSPNVLGQQPTEPPGTAPTKDGVFSNIINFIKSIFERIFS